MIFVIHIDESSYHVCVNAVPMTVKTSQIKYSYPAGTCDIYLRERHLQCSLTVFSVSVYSSQLQNQSHGSSRGRYQTSSSSESYSRGYGSDQQYSRQDRYSSGESCDHNDWGHKCPPTRDMLQVSQFCVRLNS